MSIDQFTVVDGVIALVVIASAAFGVSRGLVREVVALCIWATAVLLGMGFGSVAGDWIDWEIEPRLRGALGFAAIFVVVLLAGALVQRVLGKAVAGTGLSGTDRTLGLLFGALRGVAVAIAALVLVRPLATRGEWWSESAFVPLLLALEGDLVAIVNAVAGALGHELVIPTGEAAPAIGAGAAL